jgi:glycosyltransferase involved in cell wall biosynthesis
MPKVLLTASTFPRWKEDTVPVFILELARALVKNECEVHLIAPHYRCARQEELIDGIHVARFRYAPDSLEKLAYGTGILPNVKHNPWLLFLLPGFLIGQFATTLRLVHRHRISCINAHWIFPQGLVGLAVKALRRGTRLVVTVHGGDIFALARVRFLAPVLRLVLDHSDLVTVNSSATADAVRALCPEARVYLVPMGVDAARFAPRAADPEIRLRLAPEGHRVILFCGRLTSKKGVRYLMDAMPIILGTAPDAVLAVVGDGDERAALERQVRNLGLGSTVRFLGAVPNERLPEYYNASDVFACPSIVDEQGDTEGLGVVLLEAAASGIPAVASRVSGIIDVVLDGRTGLLVEEKNPERIAEGLLRILNDQAMRVQMGECARRMVEERFTWEHVALHFYENLFPEEKLTET